MIKKKALIISAIMLLALTASGCTLYDRMYENIQDYEIPQSAISENTDRSVVKNIDMLKDVFKSNIYKGITNISVLFDTAYEGDPFKDLDTTAMEYRTHSALGSYCIHDMEYSIKPIMSYHEATVDITYSELSSAPKDIIKLPYAYGLDVYVRSALSSNSEQIVVLIENSPYNSDEISNIVESVYLKNPNCCVIFPHITVYMFSGKGNERLYEINFDYNISKQEIIRRKALIRNLDIADKIGTFSNNDIQKVYSSAEYLRRHVFLLSDKELNTLYDALIVKRCNDEGLALAFVQMMHDLGVKCEIVYGQKQWDDRCWNIVEINNERYHIDLSSVVTEGLEDHFIRNDSDMWFDDYRWDTSSYEPCLGTLTYSDIWNS